jgi:hypothetical protein
VSVFVPMRLGTGCARGEKRVRGGWCEGRLTGAVLVRVRKRAEILHPGAWTAVVRARGGGAHPILRVGVNSISMALKSSLNHTL